MLIFVDSHMTLAKHIVIAAVLAGRANLIVCGAQIDQQYVPATTNGYGIVGASQQVHAAQTFTVGTTGILSGIDVWVTRHDNVSEPLLVDIRTTMAGVPVNADAGPDVLARRTLPAAVVAVSRPFDPPPGLSHSSRFIDLEAPHLAPEALVHIDLSDSQVPVIQGQVLAIVLRSDEPNLFRGFTYAWQGKSPGEYLGGAASYRSTADNVWYALDENSGPLSSDYAFRTYIEPIPEPPTVIVCLLAIVGCSRLRNRVVHARGLSSF
jgi:hypothetical protein